MSSTDELLEEVRRQTDDDPESARRATAGERDRESKSGSGSERSTGGFRSRLPSPSGIFSPRGFLVALVLTVGGFLVGGMVPLVGGLTGLLGIFAAGFVLGLLGRRRYLELALAGAMTGGVGFLLGRLVLSVVAGFALPLTAVGATVGLFAAILGHYFGRDLNDGLTRDV